MRVKKILAVVTAATLTMAMPLTAFADTGSTGSGTNEGHVDKKIVHVVVPANTEGAQSPFTFVMDPERLIRATVEDNAKYEGFTFPAAESDTGVYFKNGTEYKNTSDKLQVVNKGAVSQKISVSIEKVDAASGTEIGLASAKDTLVNGDNPLLYLALECAGQTKVVGAAAQTVDVVVPGNDNNYEVKLKADKSGYEYVKKATLSAWKGIELYVDGAVGNKDVTAETSAPGLKVTWSFTDPASNETDATTGLIDVAETPATAAPSIATTSYVATADTPVEITVNLGAGEKAATGIASVTYLNKSGETKTVEATTGYTFAGNKLTLTATSVNSVVSSSQSSRTYTITFNDTDNTAIDVTLTKE